MFGFVDPVNLLHELDSPTNPLQAFVPSCSCQVKFGNCFSEGFRIFSRSLHVFTSTPRIGMTNVANPIDYYDHKILTLTKYTYIHIPG